MYLIWIRNSHIQNNDKLSREKMLNIPARLDVMGSNSSLESELQTRVQSSVWACRWHFKF